MVSHFNISISGLQQVQNDNLRRLASMQTGTLTEKVIQRGLAEAERYAAIITPVDTGSWRASHMIDFESETIGQLYIDPTARNVRSGDLVLEYASEWEARGGDYAVYKRTADERGKLILKLMADVARMELGLTE